MGSVVKVIDRETGQVAVTHVTPLTITSENVRMFLALKGHNYVNRDYYSIVIDNDKEESVPKMQTKIVDIDKLYIRFNKSFWDLVSLDREAGTITIERGEEQQTVPINEVEFHTEVPKDAPL